MTPEQIRYIQMAIKLLRVTNSFLEEVGPLNSNWTMDAIRQQLEDTQKDLEKLLPKSHK